MLEKEQARFCIDPVVVRIEERIAHGEHVCAIEEVRPDDLALAHEEPSYRFEARQDGNTLRPVARQHLIHHLHAAADDTNVGMRASDLHCALYCRRRHFVVGAQNANERRIRGRMSDQSLPVLGDGDGFVVADNAERHALALERADYLRSSVRTGVIEDQVDEVGVGLGLNALHGLGEICRAVVDRCGNDDQRR